MSKTDRDDELKKKIYTKCAGLPLSIITLAGLLSTKRLSQWSKWIEIDTSKGHQFSSSAILAMSYEDLPSPEKRCLLYSSIFPKPYEIPIRRLFRLWLAEGLAGQSKDPEDLVKSYFQDLVERNMIVVEKQRLDGSPKTCRVQSFLYDDIFPAAAERGLLHVHPNTSGGANKQQLTNGGENTLQFSVRRITKHSNRGSDFDIQFLRSYISFNARKGDTPANEVDELLKVVTNNRGFGLLTVLDLENVYKPVLTETLGKLLLLKYLGLRWTFLDSIPEAVGKLPCLETLDVKHTNIPALPISNWEGKKLRHLYLNEIHFDMCKRKKRTMKVSLDKLESLWGLMVGRNRSVINWLQKLTKLRKLGLTCLQLTPAETPAEKGIIEWISKLKGTLESLRLRSINLYNKPSDLKLGTLKEHTKLTELQLFGKLPSSFDMHQLPANLRILTLSMSKVDQDPMPILGSLPYLSVLRLFARSCLRRNINCLDKSFPELRVLKLWMLEELEDWIVEKGSMPKLRELEIRCCKNLKWPAGLQHLTALKKLTLTNMPGAFASDVNMNPALDVERREFPSLPK